MGPDTRISSAHGSDPGISEKSCRPPEVVLLTWRLHTISRSYEWLCFAGAVPPERSQVVRSKRRTSPAGFTYTKAHWY